MFYMKKTMLQNMIYVVILFYLLYCIYKCFMHRKMSLRFIRQIRHASLSDWMISNLGVLLSLHLSNFRSV